MIGIIVSLVIGFFAGFIGCALLCSNESDEHSREVYFAFLDGVKEAQDGLAQMRSEYDGEVLS